MTSPVLTQALEALPRYTVDPNGMVCRSQRGGFVRHADMLAAIASLRAADAGVPTDRQLAAGALFPQVNGFSASPAAPAPQAAMEGQQAPVAFLNTRTGRVTVCEKGSVYPLSVWNEKYHEQPLYSHSAVAPSAHPVRTTIAERVEELVALHGVRGLARLLRTDPGYITRLRKGEKVNPDDDLLAEMGLRRVVLYERVGAAPSALEPQAAGVSEQQMLERVVKALGDLSFECFGGIGTTRPSVETYNASFAVLEEARALLSTTSAPAEPISIYWSHLCGPEGKSVSDVAMGERCPYCGEAAEDDPAPPSSPAAQKEAAQQPPAQQPPAPAAPGVPADAGREEQR